MVLMWSLQSRMHPFDTVVSVSLRLSVVLWSWALVSPAFAVPPPGVAATGAMPKARWIEHKVIPGEKLREIGALYGVSSDKLVEWNELDEDKPMIRIGQRLRVYTRAEPIERNRKVIRAQRGDSWSRIAKRYNVDQRKLRRLWNPEVEMIKPGDRVILWVEDPAADTDEDDAEADLDEAVARAELEQPSRMPAPKTSVAPAPEEGALSLMPVRPDGESIGAPGRGRLLRGVQLPKNDALYTLRKPENSYGSSHTVETLQRGIRDFRLATGFDGELLIADMSRQRGGRFGPHNSHRSGRDVDIRLPLAKGVPPGTRPQLESQVDWDVTWALFKALIATGQVKYIFLSRARQDALLRAARRAGEKPEDLEQLIQYPGSGRTAVVRHSGGHTEHFHVRFACGPNETRCSD